ncbi:hypothetical protein Bca52824_055381 [Brassica carinata]|uniref:Uncharacterized protein n=1 Tax=Brassica carinata TaxID=52824 RepID=A0A8X7UNM2_BRACI|nr:hypothetical protein Bca52824_055381 [Brassica carinata]
MVKAEGELPEMLGFYATGECAVDVKVQGIGNSLLSSKKFICGSGERIEFAGSDKPTPTNYSILMWLHHKVFKSDVEVNLVIKGNIRDGEHGLQEKMTSMITIVKLIYSQSTDRMEFFLYKVFHSLRPPEQLVSVPCRLFMTHKEKVDR